MLHMLYAAHKNACCAFALDVDALNVLVEHSFVCLCLSGCVHAFIILLENTHTSQA